MFKNQHLQLSVYVLVYVKFKLPLLITCDTRKEPHSLPHENSEDPDQPTYLDADQGLYCLLLKIHA